MKSVFLFFLNLNLKNGNKEIKKKQNKGKRKDGRRTAITRLTIKSESARSRI